jgi:hypothetical protein
LHHHISFNNTLAAAQPASLPNLPLDNISNIGKILIKRGDRKTAVTLPVLDKRCLGAVTPDLYRMMVSKKKAEQEDELAWLTFLKSRGSRHVL